MNVYEPFERKAPSHEDNLTRAFLIVLRAVPVAHSAWLALVRAGHLEKDRSPRAPDGRIPELHDLPPWSLDTQTSQISEALGRVVSVLQTDEPYFLERDLAPSSRRQVLDGVVAYGDELAVVIENKLAHRDVWEDQLEINVPSDVAHDPRLACVQWREVVKAWARLLQADALAPAERVLISDFLEFSEQHFPSLQPFATVRMCARNEFRLVRRARMLLSDTGMAPVEHAAGWGWYLSLPSGIGNAAIRIALVPHVGEDGDRLELQVAPADKVGQARLFHADFNADDLAALEQLGWEMRPNFHLSYMQSHLCYVTGTLRLLDYFDFWKANANRIGRVPRSEWDGLWEELATAGVVTQDDRAAFDSAFTDTGRDFAVVVPGYHLGYSVPLERAAHLDDRRALSSELADQISAMAKVLRLRFTV